MRKYNYIELGNKPLKADVVALLTQIHEYRGKQSLFLQARPDVLAGLIEIAKIQSTEASNNIEGIYTSNERLKKLVLDKTIPKTRDEQEIAGYRDVLATIHENYEYIPLKPSIILQLHRDLYKFSGQGGGVYKNANNIIAEEDADGNKSIRFQPLEAWEAPAAIEEICQAYDVAINLNNVDPLLAIPIFILDFLCIHPFNDGNGRMSRLLTLLLLYRAGYIVGKFISVEKLIEKSKETYYEVLQESSIDWHENKNDYIPFAKYMLGIVLGAYREFSNRATIIVESGGSKPERIREIIKQHLGKITKTELIKQCPDISQVTIQRTLNELHKSGEIIKIGGGRYTAYTYNRENK